MRVLVIAHGFPPQAEAGAENYAHAHAAALHRCCGDEVTVLAREADPHRPEYALRFEERDGLHVVWLNNTYRETFRFEDTYRHPAITAAAASVMEQVKPDVAHIHHLTNLSTTIVHALAARRIPSIVTLHDYWFMCHRGQLLDTALRVCEGPQSGSCRGCAGPSAGAGRLTTVGAWAIRTIEHAAPAAIGRYARRGARALAATVRHPGAEDDRAAARLAHMRGVCAEVSHFLAPSQYLHDRFVEFGIAPDRITVARNGFDHEPFRAVTRTVSDRLRLGFLGSLMVSKAPHLLIDAAARLPPGAVSVDLCGGYSAYHGDDSYRALLDARRSQPGVRFRGAIPHHRVAEALASIDVLVVPSIWPENSPLSIQEAFLAGVPVVASRIGGIPEAVADGVNGLLVAPGDVADSTRALARLLSEPGLIDALRRGIPEVRSIRADVEAAHERYLAAVESSRTSAARRPRVAAVVLNYRTPDETLLAVLSLLALVRPPDDIIVVDNDAPGAMPAELAGVAGRITYLRTGRNLGYSGGMNVGVRHALERGAAQVMLVNSDVIVPPDCLDRLQACLAAAPAAGIAGPVVLSRSEPDRIASIGMTYEPRTGRMRHRGFGARVSDWPLDDGTVVDGVSGCLMLVSSRVFDAIGLLNEEYFFSFEDLEFCLRARQSGFETVLAAHAAVHHEGGRSIGATSPARLYFAARNHLRLAAGTRGAGPLTRFTRTASILLLNLAHAVRSSGAPLPVRLAAVVRGARDYFAGRSGSGTAGV